jgi:predicted Rossmann fold flavoprotein
MKVINIIPDTRFVQSKSGSFCFYCTSIFSYFYFLNSNAIRMTTTPNQKRIAIIGGGAGGFFTAINAAENNPNLSITIFEKSNQLLGKVKVSGGGRCNVTHACFEPKELVKFYPRGHKELLGPFHSFMTGDTMEWFEKRGVALKIEEDNRVFPVSDSSQTIIDCFMHEVHRLNIEIVKQSGIKELKQMDAGRWEVTSDTKNYLFDAVVIASGGNAKDVFSILEQLGYSITSLVPSLFTFNIKDDRIQDLSGLSVERAAVKINGTKLIEIGPLLITHWGMSGPAILKLSAVGARHLADIQYNFDISVDFSFDWDEEDIREQCSIFRQEHPKKSVMNTPLAAIPKRLWQQICAFSGISNTLIWAELPQKSQNKLLETIKRAQFHVNGKSTNKEEFVTCGGIDLKQINFQDFSSKLHPNLHFVGEVLNIDALTGGFNFQAAWTGGYCIGKAL